MTPKITKKFDGKMFTYEGADAQGSNKTKRTAKEFNYALIFEIQGRWIFASLSNEPKNFNSFMKRVYHSHYEIVKIENA